MARIGLFLVLLFIPIGQSMDATEKLHDEVPSDNMVNAFEDYWSQFESYEKKILEQDVDKYKNSWERLKKNFIKKKNQITELQLEVLKKAVVRYRKLLSDKNYVENTPYVMLNLAKLLSTIANYYFKDSFATATRYAQEALDVLDELEENHRDFSFRENALYIKAIILEKLDKDRAALVVWNKLAGEAQKSIYGIYANIAVGDHLFKEERPRLAIGYYKKALDLTKRIDIKNVNYEVLRIKYRLIWAAYRSAQLKYLVDIGIDILTPKAWVGGLTETDKIRDDVIELIGDALYENNDISYAKRILGLNAIKSHSSDIALRTIQNYLAGKIYHDVIEIGEYVVGRLGTCRRAAMILEILALSYEAVKNEEGKLRSLEKLALLLPRQSLFRSRYRGYFGIISEMEKKALKAAIRLSNHYYLHGIKTGNRASFLTAASYYEIIIDFNPKDKDNNRFRLQRAHCNYFASKHHLAKKQYTALKQDYKVDLSILKVVYYQLILTSEKIWRYSFANVSDKGNDPTKSAIVIQNLRNLEKSVEDYVDRFPSLGSHKRAHIEGVDRIVNFLLLAASANQDHGDYQTASKFWHRVLVSNPNPSQRAIAIRGIIMAKITAGLDEEVIDLAKKYLRIEDWSKLGITFGNELKGILSSAVRREAKRLNNAGKPLAAAALLVAVSKEFKGIPGRLRIFRDGSYMYAIGGDWVKAYRSAAEYLEENNKVFRGDMLYLRARSLEYLMRFGEAAKGYLELGNPRFRRHPRRPISLVRAKRLALAQNDFGTAALASIAYAKTTKKRNRKVNSYFDAYQFYIKIHQYEAALAAATQRLKVSRSISDRLTSRLMIAKTNYKLKNELKSLDGYKAIVKRTKRSKHKLSERDYKAIYGETNYLLGEEALAQFVDFKILERSGTINLNVNHKLKYFEVLVKYYSNAVESGHNIYAASSNYRMGQATEQLIDELSQIALDDGLKLKTSYRKSLKNQIRRLKNLAKVSYSKNIMLANKNPALYKGNIWVKKSKIKLYGYTKFYSNRERKEEELPSAFDLNIPSQWSL